MTSSSSRRAAASDKEPAAGGPALAAASVGELEDWEPQLLAPELTFTPGDARKTGLPDDSVDLIVTSPPYWNKRDYGHSDQIGQEPTADAYVESIMAAQVSDLERIRRADRLVLNTTGREQLAERAVRALDAVLGGVRAPRP